MMSAPATNRAQGRGVERAALFSGLRELEAYSLPCDRVYFGHEFCQRRLPEAGEARRALELAEARNLPFTLVTPFVTDAGLARVRALLSELTGAGVPSGFEAVVNDWGALRMIRREWPGIPIALGRLLTKQKRGPRLMNIIGRLPADAADHFMRSNVDAPRLADFLRAQGVVRVELDNLLQGIRREPGALPASLYTPFAYISTTRLCLLMGGDQPGKNFRSIGRCSRECLRYGITLAHRDMPVPLRLQGNTMFFENNKLPPDLAALNINRIVLEPSLP